MNAFLKRLAVLSALAVVSAFCVVSGHASAGYGEAVGPIAGTVMRGDDSRGLTVRSSPSYAAAPLGYLAVGTRVNTHGRFTNGWVRIVSPIEGGWLQIANVSPVGGTAVVVGVDLPENCLRIRSGPGTGYAVVGCAALGEELGLTGLWSQAKWAQIDRPARGWVYTSQIGTSLVAFRRPSAIYPSGPTVYVPPPEIGVYGSGYSYAYPRFGSYGLYRRYPYRNYSGPRRPYHPYVRYGSPGVGVRVGPRGVGVWSGGVGVRVGRGGVRVRVR